MRVEENGVRVKWLLMGSIRTGKYAQSEILGSYKIEWRQVYTDRIIFRCATSAVHQLFIR